MCGFVPNSTGTFLPDSLSPVFPHPSGSLLSGPPLINFGTFSAPAPSMAPQGLSDSDQEFSAVFSFLSPGSFPRLASLLPLPPFPCCHKAEVHTVPRTPCRHPASTHYSSCFHCPEYPCFLLASFSLYFEIPSDLKGPTTFFLSSPLPSFSHPSCLPNQTTTVPEPPLCVWPHVSFAGDTTVTEALPS